MAELLIVVRVRLLAGWERGLRMCLPQLFRFLHDQELYLGVGDVRPCQTPECVTLMRTSSVPTSRVVIDLTIFPFSDPLYTMKDTTIRKEIV